MHDTSPSNNASAISGSTADLIAELTAVDPAAAPDIADAVAERLEAGLTPAPSAEVQNS